MVVISGLVVVTVVPVVLVVGSGLVVVTVVLDVDSGLVVVTVVAVVEEVVSGLVVVTVVLVVGSGLVVVTVVPVVLVVDSESAILHNGPLVLHVDDIISMPICEIRHLTHTLTAYDMTRRAILWRPGFG